jgi:outer membrane protein assembly factor BamB
MNRVLLLSLLVLAEPVLAGSLYPNECGSLRRENRSLSPSPIQGPVKIQWVMPACDDLGYSISNPIILSDRVVQAYRYGLRCFDRANGNRLWSWACNRQTEIYNSPTYDADRDRLYLGLVNGDTLAMDPATGKVLWVKDHIPGTYPWQNSSPLYAGGKIYVGTGGTGFSCLDPDNQQVLWTQDFAAYFGQPGFFDGTCTPAYDNGTIYLPTVYGHLFSLDAVTGHVNWHVGQGFIRYNTCLLSDEYVYSLAQNSQVECRSRANGTLVWKADTHTVVGATSGNLAICGDMLIVPGDSWVVWGLNRFTGQKVWCTRLTGNFARNTPYVVCGKIFISACHGDFYSLDGQTGHIEWRLQHGNEYTFVGWAEADGQMFVGDVKGKFYCFTALNPANPALCVCNLNATPLPTDTPLPAGQATYTPTPFITSIPKMNPSCPWTPTDSPTITNTPTITPTPTDTGTSTWSSTPTSTPSGTWSPVPTDTPTVTDTPTGTWSPIPTDTSTWTPTPTFSPTPTDTATATQSPTITSTPTRTPEHVCDPRPFPNPTDGRSVSIHVGGGPYDHIDVKVYSLNCRLVKKEGHDCKGLVEEDITCDLRDTYGGQLSNGLYYLEIETNAKGWKKDYIRKLMVLR